MTGDTRSYDAMVVGATTATVADAARSLAASGFVITAMGLTSATDYALVGTRVAGDTTPHDVQQVSTTLDPTNTALAAQLAAGYAIVGMYFDDTNNWALLER